VDYRFTDNFAGGLTLGFTNTSVSLDSSAGSSSGRSIRYGAYGTLFDEKSYGTLYVGAATDRYDNTRRVPALGLTATSKPKASEVNMDLTGGTDLWDTGVGKLSPFAGLGYDSVNTQAFTEHGAGGLNLSVRSFNAESLRSTLGVKLSGKAELLGRRFGPYVSAAWRHEFLSQSRAITAQFGTGGTFTTTTADVARDGAAVTAGTSVELSRAWSSKLGYSGDYRSGFRAHTLTGDLKFRF
jgi:uncharacterized protein with beta-barrel porin domain